MWVFTEMGVERVSVIKVQEKITVNKENTWVSSEISNKFDITNVYKSLQGFLFLFGHQKFSFQGDKIKTISNGAKIYPFLLWIIIFGLYYKGTLDSHERNTNKSMSSASHVMSFMSATIFASSIYSSVFKNCRTNLKLVQNIVYLDNALRIPVCWYKKIGFRVKCSLFFFVIYTAFIAACDIALWYERMDSRLYVLYILMMAGDLIIFQYLFDVWIIANRMKILTKQIVILVMPLLRCEGNVNIDFLTEHLTENDPKKISGKLKKGVSESFEVGIIRLMSVYDKLADNICIINNTYGVQVQKNIFNIITVKY